jgi:uncharacterized membrane protein
MKYLRLPFQHDTRAPMLALMFATTASVVFVLTRIAWTRDLHYGFLVWNLFLAWLPLLFALLDWRADGSCSFRMRLTS